MIKFVIPLLGLMLFSCSPKTTLLKNDDITSRTDHLEVIQNFIQLIKNEDKKTLKAQVLYPLRREHPLPDIENSKDFIKNYDDIFDERLVNIIVTSNPAEDWARVGARGIMLNNGLLWLDYNGSLIAVNHHSNTEVEAQNDLIEKEVQDLHASLRDFEKPILTLETESLIVRIDDLGRSNFRYASWPIDAKTTSEPEVLVTNGQYVPEGSGGNHRYVFKDGQKRYECFVIRLGASDSPPAIISIYEEDKATLSEPAKTMEN